MNIKCTMLSERRQPKNVVYYRVSVYHILSFPGALVVKNTPATAKDMGSNPGPGRSHMPQLLKHRALEPVLHKRSYRDEKPEYREEKKKKKKQELFMY